MKTKLMNHGLQLLSFFMACLSVGLSSPQKLTDEQLEALEKMENKVSPERVSIERKISFLSAYRKVNGGEWPNSWADLESEFGSEIWSSEIDKRRVNRDFVILPEIEGQLSSVREGNISAKMLLVSTNPISNQVSSNITEDGRWVLWGYENDSIGVSWHSEEELQSFSNWSRVETLLEEHEAAARLLARTQSTNPSDRQLEQRNIPLGERESDENNDEGGASPPVTVSESGEFFEPHAIILAIVAVALIGIVVVLMRSRKDDPDR